MATLRPKKTVSAPASKSRAFAPAARRQVHVLDVPFAARALVTSHGASWDTEHGVFLVSGALPDALTPFRAAPWSWVGGGARDARGVDGADRVPARRGSALAAHAAVPGRRRPAGRHPELRAPRQAVRDRRVFAQEGPVEEGARERYVQAWTAFRAELDLAPSGRDPKNALAAALRLRQKSSLIRVESTVELVHELLDNGHHVAVSVAFLETLEAIRDALARDKVGTAALHGRLGTEVREAERMRFQRGEVPVVLFTVEEGISLHQGEHDEAPRSMVIHDLRWSAIQMAQIEGRCHRDGRYAPVYWTWADDTIEERIANLVCSRIGSMKAMVGDDVETLREIARLLADG